MSFKKMRKISNFTGNLHEQFTQLFFSFFQPLFALWDADDSSVSGYTIFTLQKAFLFFITAIMKSALILKLGKNSKDIMMKWKSFENVFLKDSYDYKEMKLKYKVRLIASFFFILGNNLKN